MKAIVCMTPMKGIGYHNKLPWKSKEDLKFFKEMTIGKGNNAVVMGYNTFQSLGYRGLPNRRNYVMTRNPRHCSDAFKNDIVFESSVDNILLLNFIFDDVFIIGGESIYKLFEPYCCEVYVTVIHRSCCVDTFFPMNLEYHKKEKIKSINEEGTQLEFFKYIKPSPEEFL